MAPAGFVCTCCGFAGKIWQDVAPGKGDAEVAFQK